MNQNVIKELKKYLFNLHKEMKPCRAVWHGFQNCSAQLGMARQVICCTYNPNKINISNHLDLLRGSLDLYSAEYEHFIIVRDFNTEVIQMMMKVFCDSYEFKNLFFLYI